MQRKWLIFERLTVPGVISARQSRTQHPVSDCKLTLSMETAFRSDDLISDDSAENDAVSSSQSDAPAEFIPVEVDSSFDWVLDSMPLVSILKLIT